MRSGNRFGVILPQRKSKDGKITSYMSSRYTLPHLTKYSMNPVSCRLTIMVHMERNQLLSRHYHRSCPLSTNRPHHNNPLSIHNNQICSNNIKCKYLFYPSKLPMRFYVCKSYWYVTLILNVKSHLILKQYGTFCLSGEN